MQLDRFDRMLLAELQKDARLTNAELAGAVNLSPSQCSRRRTRLEADGFIRGYHASVDRNRTGYGVVALVSVTLSKHSRQDDTAFSNLIMRNPHVLEAHSLTGEMDYVLKVVVSDLAALSDFVGETLLSHASVQNVKSAIVLKTLKESVALPL